MVKFFKKILSLLSNISRKLYRVELIHQLVQPLLDCKASDEISYYCAGRRPAKVNEVHLVGKHYPESKNLWRKCCVLCGIRKKTENMHVKKHRTIVLNATTFYTKIALNYIKLQEIQGNDNIHV